MFGVIIPPGVDVVRLIALSGRRGKPPCIWEGPASTDQATIEAAVSSDPRIRQWLQRNHLMVDGVATLKLQLEYYSQGRLVERAEVKEASLLLGERRKRKAVGDEVTLRAMDLAEHLVGEYKQLVDERDTVIGRLVERALKIGEAPPVSAEVPAAKGDGFDDLLSKGLKFLSLAQGLKSMRNN